MTWNAPGRLAADDPRLVAPLLAVDAAIDYVRTAVSEGQIEQEEPITSALMTAISLGIEQLPDVEGVSWSAKYVIPKKGKENHNGTDVAIYLDIDLADHRDGRGYKATKTVLVQSKRRDRLQEERKKLLSQIDSMNSYADSTAVLLVGPGEGDMRAIASALVQPGMSAQQIVDASAPIGALFAALFRCQTGDHTWGSPAAIKANLEAPVLEISATDKGLET